MTPPIVVNVVVPKPRHRIRRCRRCHRRRWIVPTHVTTDRWKNEYQHYRCSKGHHWRVIISNLARADRLLKIAYGPAILRDLNQENVLLKFLEG